ncbi:MAG: hypothetical protein K9G48_14875 [Reyranella sp.]|nr:hypothetical protein [Reyranella sp.]
MSVPVRKRGRPQASPECVTAFLAELADTGAVAIAAERAGVHRSTLYDLRRRNREFAARWDAALQLGLDRLQDHAVVRATVGEETPVWQGGRQVGTVRRPDSRLLQFLLKAHRPEVYARPAAPLPAAAAAASDFARRLREAEKRMAALGKALPPLAKKGGRHDR